RDLQVFSRDGSRIAARDGPHLMIWDTRDGKVLGKLASRPVQFEFGQGKDELLLIEGDEKAPPGRVLSWRIGAKKPTQLCTLKAEQYAETPRTLRITRDGKRVFYMTRSYWTAYVWELPSGKLLGRHRIEINSHQMPMLACTNDGSKLAIMGEHTL